MHACARLLREPHHPCAPHSFVAVYFVALVVMGNYVFVNVIIALVLQRYKEAERKL